MICPLSLCCPNFFLVIVVAAFFLTEDGRLLGWKRNCRWLLRHCTTCTPVPAHQMKTASVRVKVGYDSETPKAAVRAKRLYTGGLAQLTVCAPF